MLSSIFIRKIVSSRILSFVTLVVLLNCSTAMSEYKSADNPLMTIWAEDISPQTVHREYPRPQLNRGRWKNLNGLWDYAITKRDADKPREFDGQILVPFPIESALSGVKKKVGKENKLWYRTSFIVPVGWSASEIMLNFGGVDWDSTVWVNGKKVGSHRGGYDPFSLNITDALKESGPQQLILSVWDPINDGDQPRGKQVKDPQGIWYTSVTGIWQTAWLEPVNPVHIESVKIVPDIDTDSVTITADYAGSVKNCKLAARITHSFLTEIEQAGPAGETLSINIENPQLWSPDSPSLYDLSLTLKDSDGKTIDEIESYFGMRKVALGKDKNGTTRIFLNNKPLFNYGPLDQGWWPDGLYTAPTDDALKYDIAITKRLGFNTARKHVKVEPRRWYYWCDRMGLLVWQDMPSGDDFVQKGTADLQRSAQSAEQYSLELKRMIDTLYNHPCIITWVPFNEGWGQFNSERVTNWIEEYDPTRLVDTASGWADRGVGDMIDIHQYPGPAAPQPESDRVAVLGEFGGLGLPVENHTWQKKKNWGYRNLKSKEQLTGTYVELIEELKPMVKDSLGAAIYTQTTDVESEVNGLMTYDRRIIKMDIKKISAVNKDLIQAGSE